MFRLLLVASFLFVGTLLAQQPNILFIYADDMSYRTVGAYEGSHDWVQTPHIDALAMEGVRFDNAYMGAKCAPSRGLALTGQYQYNANESDEYWVENFKAKGYYTGMIGKWHYSDVRHGKAWDWSRVWEHHLNTSHYYIDQPIRIDGGSEEIVPYSTDAYADYAVEFINDRKADNKPWYLWLAFGAVHAPYTPAERHLGTYAGKEVDIPVDIFENQENKPQYIQDLSRWSLDENGVPKSSRGTIHEVSQLYNEAVRAIDDAVGKVREALEASGMAENTLVVFSADQGYAWGQHGWEGKKHPHASAIRAPFIVYQPDKIHGNRVVKTPVNIQDLIKTFHTFTGVEPTVTLDGRDFLDVFTGVSETVESEVMLMTFSGGFYGDEVKDNLQAGNIDSFNETTGVGLTIYWNLVIKGNLKYIRYIADSYIEEMYHIHDDPDELVNLAADPKYQTNLFEMRAVLDSTLEANRADFVDLLPEPEMMYDPVLTKPQAESFKNQSIRYNPSNNSFSIENPEKKHMQVTVYSSKGATLVHKSSTGDINLPLNSVHSGAYFLSVKADGKGAFYGKFSNKTGAITWPAF